VPPPAYLSQLHKCTAKENLGQVKTGGGTRIV